MVVGTRPRGGKQPRSARGAAALLASRPFVASRKVRRSAKASSPVKRAHGGKATTSVGMASSLDRNYKRCVACERRAQYLGVPERQSMLREVVVGDRELLQK
jgi:hypothetical protein